MDVKRSVGVHKTRAFLDPGGRATVAAPVLVPLALPLGPDRHSGIVRPDRGDRTAPPHRKDTNYAEKNEPPRPPHVTHLRPRFVESVDSQTLYRNRLRDYEPAKDPLPVPDDGTAHFRGQREEHAETSRVRRRCHLLHCLAPQSPAVPWGVWANNAQGGSSRANAS